MNIKKRLELIKRNTIEIIKEEELNELLKTKKQPSVYLGTATTGKPHIGYFLWVLKLADFLKAGFKVKLLLADIHGALDNTPWNILDYRYKYYSKIIPLMFKAIGTNISKFEIVKGSDFQLKKDYILDILKMSSYTSVSDAKRAASEVVKQSDNPKISGLIYPIMQALDEEYLKVDMQYGGIDQRKILMFARENLPKVGYKPRIEFMTPLIPGLTGSKMSASEESSKIDLLDDQETVERKVNAAFCPEGEIENNGVLAFFKYVIFTLNNDQGKILLIERPSKFGGNAKYKEYLDLEKDFKNKKIHPLDLKKTLAREINMLLEPIRKEFKDLDLIKKAYPN
ncbi:MAG TPA: tyrosine--tRNA ligase [Candidatus Nanoarchaeia archaeon]|nr:tyrosine--tRNA ligase [Candidatus Nanoarchaeia archaeon]